MIEVILATTSEKGGLGFKNGLPWGSTLKDDLTIFRAKTLDHVLIVGYKTFQSLPEKIKAETSRIWHVLPRQFNLIEEIANLKQKYPFKKIFVVGGASVYESIFSEMHRHLITRVHHTTVEGSFECDVFFNVKKYMQEFGFQCYGYSQKLEQCSHQEWVPSCEHGENQYLKLLKSVLDFGTDTKGRNGLTKHLFGQHLKFDLRQGFPLLTTKKMFFRGIGEELLFFIRGDTNTKLLEEKGVNIWKGNTSREFLETNPKTKHYEEGEMGPMYGYQWRFFNKPFKSETNADMEYVDQLKNVLHLIKTDPGSRRILMTDFNPAQALEGVLYPCHSIILQFVVDNEFLDMFCFNRSSDLFLGLPFNIASSSLLLEIISKLTGKTARILNLSLGDCHIYEEHIQAVETQISRVPLKMPCIKVNDDITLENLTCASFALENYKSYEAIKAKMIA